MLGYPRAKETEISSAQWALWIGMDFALLLPAIFKCICDPSSASLVYYIKYQISKYTLCQYVSNDAPSFHLFFQLLIRFTYLLPTSNLTLLWRPCDPKLSQSCFLQHISAITRYMYMFKRTRRLSNASLRSRPIIIKFL